MTKEQLIAAIKSNPEPYIVETLGWFEKGNEIEDEIAAVNIAFTGETIRLGFANAGMVEKTADMMIRNEKILDFLLTSDLTLA